MANQENEDVDKRIKSLLAQLQLESAILDKIAYKGENQHRRASYFQYLLKVRRELKLLQSANLVEILDVLFQVINEKKPNVSAKKRKFNNDKHHFQLRLLGVARLLSQMVEPMIKAAIEFSTLLARTFFMGFSLSILALLARLRVLVQQILLDVVSVFNMFASSSQGSQTTLLNVGGVQFFREYHPSDNNVIALECVWETDKFVLLEKTTKIETTSQVQHGGSGMETPLRSSNIKYQTIEAFLEGDELGCQKDADQTLEDLSDPSKERSHATDASLNQLIEINNEMEVGDEDEGQEGSAEKNLAEVCIKPSTSAFPSQKLQSESRSKVAFVSVDPSKLSQLKQGGSLKNEFTANSPPKAPNNEEDSFFSLLTAGHKESLF